MTLDQFFTKPKVAKSCIEEVDKLFPLKHFGLILEPSVGNGSFFNQINLTQKRGVDLDPKIKHRKIRKKDFLEYEIPRRFKNKTILVIGNPPFGKRSRLSVDFFNKATEYADVIAFIIPIQWRKWSVQSKLNPEWRLIFDKLLEENSFFIPDTNEDYKVRTCFQIWSKNKKFKNLRLKSKPQIEHPDFEMYLYNNTKGALKFFDYDWDVAIPRQGYIDYSRKETKKENCEKTTQWIFIKAKNKSVLKKIKSIDFENLSKKNTITPGWGKADLVEEYQRLFDLH